jgi:uncharacterized protein
MLNYIERTPVNVARFAGIKNNTKPPISIRKPCLRDVKRLKEEGRMAKCPRCEREMQLISIESCELDICSSCRGIWFDADELSGVMRLDLANLSILPFYQDLEGKKQTSLEQVPSFCPRCSGPLDQRRFNQALPVIIDVCPQQHGLWLDEGELFEIKEFCERGPVQVLPADDDLTPQRIEEIRDQFAKDNKALKGFKSNRTGDYSRLRTFLDIWGSSPFWP